MIAENEFAEALISELEEGEAPIIKSMENKLMRNLTTEEKQLVERTAQALREMDLIY